MAYRKSLLTADKIVKWSKRARRLYDDYLEVKYLDTSRQIIDLVIKDLPQADRKLVKDQLDSYVTGLPPSKASRRNKNEYTKSIGNRYGYRTLMLDSPFTPTLTNKKKIANILTKTLSKDISNNYYSTINKQDPHGFMYDSIMDTANVFDMEPDEKGIFKLKQAIDKYNLEKHGITYVGDNGVIVQTTAGERRLLKINKALARGTTDFLEHMTYRTMKRLIRFMMDTVVPMDRRKKYYAPEKVSVTNLSKMAHFDMVNDLKNMSDEVIRDVPNLVSNYSQSIIEVAEREGGILSEGFRRWYHMHEGEDFFLYVYDMSYEAHFGYLTEYGRGFDICDIYSGQFVVSHPAHPNLNFSVNRVEDVSPSMYDWRAGPISRLYQKMIDSYNRSTHRKRTYKSLNYPRGGKPKESILLTLPELCKSIIDASDVEVDHLKNVYEDRNVPQDHPNGFCTISMMSLRQFLDHYNVRVPEPEKEVEPATVEDAQIEREDFVRDRIASMFSTVFTDYIWSKRDKNGNLVGVFGMRKAIEDNIVDAALGLEKGFGWRDAVTIDAKKKELALRMRLGPGVIDNDTGMVIQDDVLRRYGMFTKENGKSTLYNQNGDSMGVFVNPDKVRREYPGGPVSKNVVWKRTKTYVTAAGDRSPVGDLIIYTRNVEYLIKNGIKSDVFDQIAYGFGEQFLSASKISMWRTKKYDIVDSFRSTLNKLRRDKAEALTVNLHLKKAANLFYKAKETKAQLKAITFLLVRDPEVFGELFGSTFKIFQAKAEEMLNERIYLSIIKKAGL